jgi:hypothetical protein
LALLSPLATDSRHIQPYSAGYFHDLFISNGLNAPKVSSIIGLSHGARPNRMDQPGRKAGISLDLGIEWYRDVLQAKLVSLRLPRRLLIYYKEKLLGSLDVEID